MQESYPGSNSLKENDRKWTWVTLTSVVWTQTRRVLNDDSFLIIWKRPMEGQLDQAYQNQFDGPPEAKRSVPDTNSSSATFTDGNIILISNLF